MGYGRVLFLAFLLAAVLLTGCKPDADDLRFIEASRDLLITRAKADEFPAMRHQYGSYISDLAEHGRWGKKRTEAINAELATLLLGKITSLDPIAVSPSDEMSLDETVTAINNPELTQAWAAFQVGYKEARRKVELLKDRYPILVKLNDVTSNVPLTIDMKWNLHGALVRVFSQTCYPFSFFEKHDKPYAVITVDVALQFTGVEYVDTRNMGPMGDAMTLQVASAGAFAVSYSRNLQKYAATGPARFTAEREPTPMITVTNGRVNNSYSSEFYELVQNSKLADQLKLNPDDFLQ